MSRRDHNIARSAECRLAGESTMPPEVIKALVRKARRAGVIVFLKSELAQLPTMTRAVIEGEHRRLFERRG